jgi:hypothetical protein
MADLHNAIEAFAAAKAALYAAFATDLNADAQSFPEWEPYEAAERAVVVCPCQTMDEVRAKARFFIENDGPYDTIRNCADRENDTLLLFLRSLAGGASCD